MIISDPKIKSYLLNSDMIDFTKELADSVFLMNEDGNVDYAPYMFDVNFKLLFYVYCVDGIEYEFDTDGKLENILIAVEQSSQVNQIFDDYMRGAYKDLPIWNQISKIRKNANLMIDFRKQVMIRKREDDLGNLIDALTEISKMISKIDFSKFDSKIITQILVASMMKSGVKPEQISRLAQIGGKNES